ncbi:hypothetical protein ACJX0J_030628, partial [Zea mays]
WCPQILPRAHGTHSYNYMDILFITSKDPKANPCQILAIILVKPSQWQPSISIIA